jgi:hypothetical protein
MPRSPTAFPLSWPSGWKRTPPAERTAARFGSRGNGALRSLTVAQARERLQQELEMLRADDAVLSTNVQLRLDGQPRSDRAEPADPGVAVYFVLDGRDMVLACDRWDTVGGNIAALAAHIGALRGMDRWGVGSLEQAFTGYVALPAPATSDWQSLLGDPSSLAEAEANWRAAMRTAHPDQGGSTDRAAALNAAMTEARRFYAE